MPSILSTALLIISKIPLFLKTILYHVLNLAPTSRKWDLRTAVVVTMIRDFLANTPLSSVSAQQALFMSDRGVRGKMWVSKVTLPAPPPDDDDDDLRRQLFQAVAALGTTGREEYSRPPLRDVGGEWVGYRPGVSDWAREPAGLTERDKYERLARDARSEATVLYIHGGANYLMDPVSTRPAAAAYAKHSRGRVFSVRYRLAPQGPFPSALLDVLVAYLSLLYPPPGSFHAAVPASSLIVAGDSAGGNIGMSLLQLLLQLRRSSAPAPPAVRFHGALVPVPLPAGVALSSPSLDITRSMQWSAGAAAARYDYLPAPPHSPAASPPCGAWPARPPRVHLYCESSALAHPLVSPMAARSWAGAPPVFVVCGEELLAGEGRDVARRMALQGVPVVWEQYEAMPHCFALVLTWTRAADMSFRGWAGFVRDALAGTVETRGTFVLAKSLERREVDVKTLTLMSDEDVWANMEAYRVQIEERFSYLLK